jgi:hypothetical protein
MKERTSLLTTTAFDARWAIDVLTILAENKNLNIDRLLGFANQFNARSKLKEGLYLLANETPKIIDIDRKLLTQTANQIKEEPYLIEWFFNEAPRTADLDAYRNSRFTWFKIVIRTYFYVPGYVWFYNKVTLSDALGLSLSFPPLSMFQSIKTIFSKVLEKFPLFFFNHHPKIRSNKTR